MKDKGIPIFFCFILAIGVIFPAGCICEENNTLSKAASYITNASEKCESSSCAVADSPNEDTDFEKHFMATELLTRPTNRSVMVSLIPKEDLEIFFEYGNLSGSYFGQTPAVYGKAGSAINAAIQGLLPDKQYYYRTCYKEPGSSIYKCGPEHTFHTQRSPGSIFIFDVQADSHLDERASGDLYRQTLKNELSDKPDFLIDLGDTFMTDKLPTKNNKTYLPQYLRQRSFFNSIGSSVPLFLVLGNHDGEAGYALDGTGSNIAVLSLYFRKTYFPDPEPDGFYTGNSENEEFTGLQQDYYSWEWGDALFVVLDPYWHTTTKPGGRTDPWAWTLGKVQYLWLKETLEKSRAKYKFIFSHQLVGGDIQGRGGIECASLYEWGGKNSDGSWGFSQHRPGWNAPIHELLVENNVTAFFHGHDHLFAKQELDGIIYQEVPQPATICSPKADPGAEYGYTSGVKLGSPGHLRINVSSGSVQVDYIRSDLPDDSRSGIRNGAIAYSYKIFPIQNS